MESLASEVEREVCWHGFVCLIAVAERGGPQEEKLQYFSLRRSKNCLLDDDDNGTTCHSTSARGFHVESSSC